MPPRPQSAPEPVQTLTIDPESKSDALTANRNYQASLQKTPDISPDLQKWMVDYLLDLVRTHFNQGQWYQMLRSNWEHNNDQTVLQELVNVLLVGADKRPTQMIQIAAKQMNHFMAVDLAGLDHVRIPKYGTTVDALRDDDDPTSVRDYISNTSPEADEEDVKTLQRTPPSYATGNFITAGFIENPRPHKPADPVKPVEDEHLPPGVKGHKGSDRKDGLPAMQFIPDKAFC